MTVLLLSFILSAFNAQAAPSPTPELDQEFLLLPAYEIERVSPAAGTAVRVGDRVRLRIDRFQSPENGVKLEQPPGGSETIQEAGFEILDPSAPSAAPVSPGVAPAAGEAVVDAVILKGGKISLPSLAIKNIEGKAVGRTNPFSLDATSAIKKDDPKPEEAVGLQGPVSLKFPWLLVVLVVVIALVLLAGIIYGLKRWSAAKRPFVPPPIPEGPPRPEDEVALEALLELEGRGLTRKGQFKLHYFGVSEILKRYIGARYRFEALESTSREIITRLEEKRALGDDLIDRLETLFESLDRVKFTDHVPAADEGVALVALARQLVVSTRKPPTPVSLEPSVGSPRAL